MSSTRGFFWVAKKMWLLMTATMVFLWAMTAIPARQAIADRLLSSFSDFVSVKIDDVNQQRDLENELRNPAPNQRGEHDIRAPKGVFDVYAKLPEKIKTVRTRALKPSFQAEPGTSFTILQAAHSGFFGRIKLQDGRKGWCFLPLALSERGCVAAGLATGTLREEAILRDENLQELISLSAGTRVGIMEQDAGRDRAVVIDAVAEVGVLPLNVLDVGR